ncbi:MAG: LLM class flavin-dependent oxidoreductase [Paracoccaceae bacterium]
MTELLFNAFVMNTCSHIQHGMWRHPAAQQHRFDDVNLWIDVAKTLEKAKFDVIFFADVVGLYGPLNGNYDLNVREGLQIPSNDPSVLVAALATHTEHLGLAFTSSILQSHPFEFARRVSTLDHIARGRIAWNIVTSTQENAARNFGLDRLTEHDARYEWAEEYMEVVYKLWEGSWDDGASLRDKKTGLFGDPSLIHKIHHRGPRYQVEGPHLPSPSLQRTPFLFQAGSSGAGRGFAARHAEGQFISPPTPEAASDLIADTRALAVAEGRNAGDIRFFQGMSFILGSTEAEAQAKLRDYEEYLSAEGFLAHANLGVDQDTGEPYAADTPLKDIRTNGGQSHINWLRQATPGREPTVGDLGRLLIRRHSRFVGTPEQAVPFLRRWQEAGIDGINLVNFLIPDSYVDIAEHLLPELRKHGLAKTDYREGSLREKITGSAHLPGRHAGAKWRGAFSRRQAEAVA